MGDCWARERGTTFLPFVLALAVLVWLAGVAGLALADCALDECCVDGCADLVRAAAMACPPLVWPDLVWVEAVWGALEGDFLVVVFVTVSAAEHTKPAATRTRQTVLGTFLHFSNRRAVTPR